jgi:hypothetical protein
MRRGKEMVLQGAEWATWLRILSGLRHILVLSPVPQCAAQQQRAGFG